MHHLAVYDAEHEDAVAGGRDFDQFGRARRGRRATGGEE